MIHKTLDTTSFTIMHQIHLSNVRGQGLQLTDQIKTYEELNGANTFMQAYDSWLVDNTEIPFDEIHMHFRSAVLTFERLKDK